MRVRSGPRARIAIFSAALLILAVGPQITLQTTAGTRLQPGTHTQQTSNDKLPLEDECIEQAVAIGQGESLSADRIEAMRRLVESQQQGGAFSREEVLILDRFRRNSHVGELEADVVISRALLIHFVLRQQLNAEQAEILQRYLIELSARDREPADLKAPDATAVASEQEPNDVPLQATSLPTPRTAAVISGQSDVDVYAVDARGAGSLMVSLEMATAPLDESRSIILEVVDGNGVVCGQSRGSTRVMQTSLPAAGRYYVSVSSDPRAGQNSQVPYALSLSVACATESISREDPRLQRVHPFEQGQTCTAGPMRHSEAYEYNAATSGAITASVCPSGGGSSDYDSFIVVYQAPGGTQITPFSARGCENALAANNDYCGEQAQVSAEVEAGFFYIVVTGRCGESLGNFALEVEKDSVSLPCTRVTPPGDGTGEPELSVTMTDTPDPVATNGIVVYSILIQNLRHGPRQNVVATDVLPPEVAYESCTTTLGTCAVNGSTVTVNVGRLEGGASVTITISARVLCDVASGTAFGNTVAVRSQGGGHDEESVFAEVTCSTESQTVNPAPVIGSTPSVQAVASSLQGCTVGAYVDFPMPTATDNCPGQIGMTCAPASGSFFPIGITNVVVTATDAMGASSTATFAVTVGSPFGVCCMGDATADSYRQVIDATSPLYGYWQYTVAATGAIYCGTADSVTYIPGRSLQSYDRTDPYCSMTATISYASGTAVIRLLVRATGRTYVLRDRNINNTPPC